MCPEWSWMLIKLTEAEYPSTDPASENYCVLRLHLSLSLVVTELFSGHTALSLDRFENSPISMNYILQSVNLHGAVTCCTFTSSVERTVTT